jgi:hypothetical protein
MSVSKALLMRVGSSEIRRFPPWGVSEAFPQPGGTLFCGQGDDGEGRVKSQGQEARSVRASATSEAFS